MERKYKLCFSIVFLLVACSCGKLPHNTSFIGFAFKDSECYVRELFSKSKGSIDRNLREPGMVTMEDMKKGELYYTSEIQYLIVNGNTAIYFTTAPSKYISNMTSAYYVDNKYPNAYFLNFLYIGTVKEISDTEREFDFKNQKSEQVWSLKKRHDKWELVSIDNKSISRSGRIKESKTMKTLNVVTNAVRFRKEKDFFFSYENPYDNPFRRKKTSQELPLKADTLWFAYNENRNYTQYNALLRFNDTLEVTFGPKRFIYSVSFLSH